MKKLKRLKRQSRFSTDLCLFTKLYLTATAFLQTQLDEETMNGICRAKDKSSAGMCNGAARFPRNGRKGVQYPLVSTVSGVCASLGISNAKGSNHIIINHSVCYKIPL